jgi:hypothetical protein
MNTWIEKTSNHSNVWARAPVEIEMLMTEMEMTIANLIDTVDMLWEKLSPIRINLPVQETDGCSEPERSELSPLGELLNKQTSRVLNVKQEIQHIMKSLSI